MTLSLAQLQQELTDSMRARDELRTSTLRLTLAAVHAEEVAGKAKRELSDAEVEAVVTRELKKRREAATAFADGGRPDRAERELAEAGILESYLPVPLDDAEIEALVAAAVAESGATDMGAAMRAAKTAVGTRADGGRIAAAVRRALAG